MVASEVDNQLDRGGSGRMAWSAGAKAPLTVPNEYSNEDRAKKGCWSKFSTCFGGKVNVYTNLFFLANVTRLKHFRMSVLL